MTLANQGKIHTYIVSVLTKEGLVITVFIIDKTIFFG